MEKRPSLTSGDPTDIGGAIARLRRQFLNDFDPAYVEHVIVPYFLVSTYEGDRLSLPLFDVKFTKENALPSYLWWLLSDSLKPSLEDGGTVSLQALEKRGPDNLWKKMYIS